jgi:hypothetical protein
MKNIPIRVVSYRARCLLRFGFVRRRGVASRLGLRLSRAEEHDDKDVPDAPHKLARSLSNERTSSLIVAPALVSVPSMLQGLASRPVRLISRVHPRPVNALGRPLLLLPLVSGGHVPAAAPSVRHYAQTPPGGQGPAGGGGFPGFKFPMQQQYEKGDALKEFVRALLGALLVYSAVADLFFSSVVCCRAAT